MKEEKSFNALFVNRACFLLHDGCAECPAIHVHRSPHPRIEAQAFHGHSAAQRVTQYPACGKVQPPRPRTSLLPVPHLQRVKNKGVVCCLPAHLGIANRSDLVRRTCRNIFNRRYPRRPHDTSIRKSCRLGIVGMVDRDNKESAAGEILGKEGVLRAPSIPCWMEDQNWKRLQLPDRNVPARACGNHCLVGR